MSSQFSTLMALSAMQTQQSQAAVQSALAERKRKEEQRRKEQELRETKQKELETKLRLKHFEDEKREKERQERKERERAAQEAEKEKREAAQRDALRYGPKKAAAVSRGGSGASGYPSVNGHTREELRKNRFPSDEEDDGGSVLTREEKRQRRLQSDMKFGASRSKRSGQSGGGHKSGRRLPGGALDVMGEGSSQSPGSSQSVKARLAAMPNTLTRLNVVKRDTRTIDEIVRDREREKERRVLNGDQAKDFHDWFGKDKKKEVALPKKTAISTPNSRSNTPGSQSSASASASKSSGNGASTGSKKNATKAASSLPSFSKDPSSGKSPSSKPGLKPTASDANLKSLKHKTSVSTSKLKYPSSSHNSSSKSPYPGSSSAKKRPRSLSLSSHSSRSPPSKRHAPGGEETYKSEIWKIFGKDRSRYVSNYVDSDDDDMEADASVLEREEMRSARIARKEDEAALRDEKSREDEKRRKKMEKERR